MTDNELAIERLKDIKTKVESIGDSVALDIAISALKGEWIPINDIEDIPKSGSYWVTKDYAYSTDVEKIRWSDTWRCWVDCDTDDVLTKESASLIIAYMPYFEPEPYKKGE